MKKLLLITVLISFTIAKAQIINIPDANFKSTLLNASTSNNIARDINGLNVVIDVNNDGEIQISEALNIYQLNVIGANILDITGVDFFTNLQWLKCGDNQLNNLSIPSLTNLAVLSCEINQLSSLDLSNQTNLYELWCGQNQFIDLDLSNQTNLSVLLCTDNQNLTYINLKNGNNDGYNGYSDDFMNLPNLQTVCVDELNTDFTNLILDGTGHSVTFTTDCSVASLPDFKPLNFLVFPSPVENILNIESNTKIIEIKIYSRLGQLIKETLENTIDISNLTQGLYFVKVKDINGNIGIKKVIKK